MLVYPDASCTGAGAYTIGLDQTIVHQMWSPDERKRSSTWSEVKAIELALLSFDKRLFNNVLNGLQITRVACIFYSREV